MEAVHMKYPLLVLAAICSFSQIRAQEKTNPVRTISNTWVSDLGNGRYKNPVLNADYSDPDAIRVGDDFYLTASSFDAVPGLPILHSKDLVNWTLINHALQQQIPAAHFSKTQHGNGVWAPAIRFHNKEYYIYYPDPDFGIYMIKSADPGSTWSDPVLVQKGKGLIDPCPLWDDNGKVYLAYAFAGSRAGIKSVLAVKELNTEGSEAISAGQIVYDGHETDPTIEGPKLYKRNGYYYIFAPAGGVSTGWQLVLRSKNIYGPYERKVVMDQGASKVNGPHQGAWVDTQSGEDWFLHFQDKGVLGRVLHLQPMKWVKDWPVIGADPDGDGKGEPVMTCKKPNVGETYPPATPVESDEFNSGVLGLQWQWQANPAANWSFFNAANGSLRLYTVQMPDSALNIWDAPNVLLQKFPNEEFTATAKLVFKPNVKLQGERTGIVVMGKSYAGLALKSGADGLVSMVSLHCRNAIKGTAEREEVVLPKISPASEVYLRVKLTAGKLCRFSYSLDGARFVDAGDVFEAEEGLWIGAKMGLFALRNSRTNDSGYADVDWFRVEHL